MSETRASEGTPSPATPAPSLELSRDDLVYWLTNGVGEVPEVEHTPWDIEEGGGRAFIYVGGCVMAEVPYNDDIEDEGVLAVANAIAGAGAEILRLRAELASTRSALREAQEAGDDAFAERTVLRETVFFFASVIRSGESWSAECDAALIRATAPIGTHRAALDAAAGSTRP